MVARRRRDPGTVLPDWVLAFDERAWSTPGGFNGWRAAVRVWCRETDLAKTDLDAWLAVIRGTVSANHRRDGWTANRPDLTTAILTNSITEESEAH